MNGIYYITSRASGKLQACINAPRMDDPNQIKHHWVASQGMSESARSLYQIDFCPVINWDDGLKDVFTPISEIEARPKNPAKYLAEFVIKERNCDYPEHDQKGVVESENSNSGLCIQFEGYGVFGCQPNVGGPIFIERYEGKLRLLVWADINKEDPTDIIELDAALESNREDDSCRYCGQNCPNEPDDSENLCDGFAGDVDGLYKV